MRFFTVLLLLLPALSAQWKKHIVAEGYANQTAIAADFTGDGKPDVVSNDYKRTILYVAPDWKPVVLHEGLHLIHSAVFDVDGDGDIDLIGAQYSPAVVVWFERPANPLKDPWPMHAIDSTEAGGVDGVHGLMAGDVNKDGKPDLAATSGQPKGPFANSVVWFEVPPNPRTAKGWIRHVVANHDAPGLNHYVGIGDVDGDGRPDIASAAKVPPDGNWFAWWRQPARKGDPWTKHVLATEQDGATNILIGDLNGDGKADMAASRGHSKGVVWFEAPKFTMREIDSNIGGPHSLAMADIDKDGDLDIATCGKDSKEAAWYENDGKGKFTRHLMGANQASYDVRLVDMNGDGFLDFLVCGENSKNVVWYENPGRRQAQGAALYQKACAACHESQGPSRIPSREALAMRSADAIVRSLTSGVMHAQGKSLTPADHALIAEYLTGKKPGEASAGLTNPCGSSPPFAHRDSGWIGWSPGVGNTRFQPEAGFTAAEVPRLRLKWAFGFEGDTVAFASPSVSGGRVFTGSQGGQVVSLDAKTGCAYWMYDAGAGVRTAVEIDGSGVAYFGDLRAQVHAVDASTGKPIWKVRVDEHPHARITGSPRLHEGVLYVPVASFEESAAADPKYSCCSFRGSVVALEAKSGTVIWKTWMIDRAASETGANRGGSKRYGPSGIGVWVAPTIDPARPLLYVATGDNYSEPATEHSDALIALERKTGRIVWSRQVTPNDIWNASCPAPGKDNCPDDSGPDADFGAAPVLVEIGDGKRVLLAGQKSGVVWALDPDRGGTVLWSRRVGKGGALGGIQWGIASDGGRVYAGVSDVEWFHFGGRLRGGFRIDPSKGGGLHAVDVRTGEVSWSAAPSSCGGREKCSPAQSGAVTAMRGVVFSGSYDGFVRAYETNAGRVVWQFDTRREFETVNGVQAKGGSLDSAGPVIAEGMMFVNSGYGTFGGEAGNVLLAFSVERN